MRYFYICHSPQEHDFAQQLADLLRQAFKSATIQLSEQQLSTEDLLAEIGNCEIFIYLISPTALGSGRWEAQVQEAIRLGKVMQPIQVRPTRTLFALPGRFAPLDMTQGLTQEKSAALLDTLSRLQQAEIQLRPPNRLPVFAALIVIAILMALGVGYLLQDRDKDSEHAERLVEKTNTQVASSTQAAIATNPDSPTPTTSPSSSQTTEVLAAATASPSSSPTLTSSPSATQTHTTAPSVTATNTITATPSSTRLAPSDSAASQPSRTNTMPPSRTITRTPTSSLTSTQTASSTRTPRPSSTPTATATMTSSPTRTRTFTPIPSPTRTHTATSSLTLIPTNTLFPSSTPTLTFTPLPTLTPTIDAQTIVCNLAPKTRLQVNQSARVIYGEGVRLREMPGFNGAILDMVAAGIIVRTVSLPVCRDDILWWEVKLENGQTGWIAEGQPDLYYLEPVTSEE
ncbi:MAG: hypothetical protein K8L91_23635 [Anaerolineae bacterium]|nr:hypothetical protein [Anaerolineae bacterium]